MRKSVHQLIYSIRVLCSECKCNRQPAPVAVLVPYTLWYDILITYEELKTKGVEYRVDNGVYIGGIRIIKDENLTHPQAMWLKELTIHEVVEGAM